MDNDEYEVIYYPQDDENRVYCNICDKLCIEQYYNNHLKSQTHTNNTRKRQQTNTHFECDFFDIDMQIVSKTICLKLLNHKKCLREKYIIINLDFFEVDKILGEHVGRNNRNFDFYFVNCEFKLELNNIFNPHKKRENFYNSDIISMEKHLLNWVDYFMLRGYKFCKINEMIIQTISNRRDMTYKRFINHPMSMCERRLNLIIAKNPHLINSLDRSKNHPLIRKYSHIPINISK